MPRIFKPSRVDVAPPFERCVVAPELSIGTPGPPTTSDKLAGELRVICVARTAKMSNFTMALRCFAPLRGRVLLAVYGPMEDKRCLQESLAILRKLPPIVEALSAGVPVLISDQTPWTSVNENGANWALPLNSESKFTEVLQALVDMGQEEYGHFRLRALEYFDAHCSSDVALKENGRLFSELPDGVLQ